MKYLLLISLLAVSGWAKRIDCEKFPNFPRCNVTIDKAKGVESYCAVFGRGKTNAKAGEFIQLFPLSFCDEENQSSAEQEAFVFVPVVGGQVLAVADSAGVGFELELTKGDSTSFLKAGKVKFTKPVVLKKKSKIKLKGKKK